MLVMCQVTVLVNQLSMDHSERGLRLEARLDQMANVCVVFVASIDIISLLVTTRYASVHQVRRTGFTS